MRNLHINYNYCWGWVFIFFFTPNYCPNPTQHIPIVMQNRKYLSPRNKPEIVLLYATGSTLPDKSISHNQPHSSDRSESPPCGELTKLLRERNVQLQIPSPQHAREKEIIQKLSQLFNTEVIEKGLSRAVRSLFFNLEGPAQIPSFLCMHNKYLCCRDTIVWAAQVVTSKREITEEDVLTRGWFGLSDTGSICVADFKENYWRNLLLTETKKVRADLFSEQEIITGKIICEAILTRWAPQVKICCLCDTKDYSNNKNTAIHLAVSIEDLDNDTQLVKKYEVSAVRDAELLLNFRKKNAILFKELAQLQGFST